MPRNRAIKVMHKSKHPFSRKNISIIGMRHELLCATTHKGMEFHIHGGLPRRDVESFYICPRQGLGHDVEFIRINL